MFARRAAGTSSGARHLGIRRIDARFRDLLSYRQSDRGGPMQRLIPQIGIVMSSDKDLPRMREGAEFLYALGIPFEMTALSPYRVPDQVREYGVGAEGSGYEVIMAGSGGTNELACMIASY